MNEITKPPPNVPDLEQAVLGAVLLEKYAIHQVIKLLEPESFYDPRHVAIFKAVVDMFAASEEIDLLTVTQKLRATKKLDFIGGAFYLTDLTTRINSAAHIETHARIIKEAWIKRRIIEVANDMLEKGFNEEVDAIECLDTSIESMTKVVNQIQQGQTFDLKETTYKVVESAMYNPDQSEIIGVPCGMESLDRFTAGWQPNSLIIIAARTSMGKTAFALQCALNAAVIFGKKVAVFSIEMTAEECLQRMIASHSNIELSKFKKAQLQGAESMHVQSKIDDLIDKNIHIDADTSLSIISLRAKCYVLKNTMGLDMIVVDYLQLMKTPARLPREQAVAQISRGLKVLAKEFSIPVMALAQVSRKSDDRPNKEPTLSDLRESGAIEQDADMVCFLFRPEYYHIPTIKINGVDANTANMALLNIDKNRNGALGRIPLKFIGKFTRFQDWDNVTQDSSQGLLDYTEPLKDQPF